MCICAVIDSCQVRQAVDSLLLNIILFMSCVTETQIYTPSSLFISHMWLLPDMNSHQHNTLDGGGVTQELQAELTLLSAPNTLLSSGCNL